MGLFLHYKIVIRSRYESFSSQMGIESAPQMADEMNLEGLNKITVQISIWA